MYRRFLANIKRRGALVLVLLIMGEGIYLGTQHNVFSFLAKDEKAFTVVFRKDGIYPATLAIPKNARVTFVSETTETFWPASDLHPTHTIYPEFDPKRPLEPGERWTFQFKKTGTWHYHDHLHPLFRAVIVVGEGNRQSSADCTGNLSEQKQCWQDHIDETLRSGGITAALDFLEEQSARDKNFQNDCHAFAHLIGRRAYELYSRDREVDLSAKTYYCSYGFYHGFMESLFQQSGNYQEARDFCTYAGKKMSAETPDAELGCYHGVGHGYLDGDDPRYYGNARAMLEPALALCDEVGKTETVRQACASGAFDGLGQAYILGHFGLKPTPDDPYQICRNVAQPYFRETCYDILVTVAMRLGDDQFVKAARFVEAIPETNYAVAAIYSLGGYETAYYFFKREPPQQYSTLIEHCRSLQERLQLPCIGGLASGLVENGEPGKEEYRVLDFCQQTILNREERAACLQSAGRVLRSILPLERYQKVCSSLKEPDRHNCETS